MSARKWHHFRQQYEIHIKAHREWERQEPAWWRLIARHKWKKREPVYGT